MQQGLDELFGLAVGSWGVGPRALYAQLQYLRGLLTWFGAVGAAVIREHPPALNALKAKPGHSSFQLAIIVGLLNLE